MCTYIHCCPIAMICRARSIPEMNNRVPSQREDFVISTFLPCTSVILSLLENPHPPIFFNHLHTPPTPNVTYSQSNWNPAQLSLCTRNCFRKNPGARCYLMVLVAAFPLTFTFRVDNHQIFLYFIHLISKLKSVSGHFVLLWWEISNE